MKLNVMIPTYNAEATLGATLRSVQNQSLPLKEVTVVDDGSSDATERLARSFQGVRYVRNDRNLGCSNNWNRCLEMADGDYICLLHMDDVLMPDWHACLTRAVAAAAKPLETSYFCGFAGFSHGGGLAEVCAFGKQLALYEPCGLLRRLWAFCYYGLMTSACMVYGRESLKRLGNFPSAQYPNMADVPFHWNLLLDHPIVYDPGVRVLIRRGAPGQLSASRRGELTLGALRAFLAVRDRLARALGVSEDIVTMDYLLPYSLQRLLWRHSPGRLPPNEVICAFDEARANCGHLRESRAILRFVTERARRWVQKHRIARSTESVLSKAERADGYE